MLLLDRKQVDCYDRRMIHIHLGRLLGERKMKMSELAMLADISKNALSDLYHEKTDSIRFETLEKICKVLQCSVGELIEYIPDKAGGVTGEKRQLQASSEMI